MKILKSIETTVFALLILITGCGGSSSAPKGTQPASGKPAAPEAPMPSVPTPPEDENKPKGISLPGGAVERRVVTEDKVLSTETLSAPLDVIYVDRDSLWDFDREISKPIIIRSGATVTIAEGSRLTFKNRGAIVVGDCGIDKKNSPGNLMAKGSPTNPILMTIESLPSTGDPIVDFRCTKETSKNILTSITWAPSPEVKPEEFAPLYIGEGAELALVDALDFSRLPSTPLGAAIYGEVKQLGTISISSKLESSDPWLWISADSVKNWQGGVQGGKLRVGLLKDPAPKSGVLIHALPNVTYVSRFALEAWFAHTEQTKAEIVLESGAKILLGQSETLQLNSDSNASFGTSGTEALILQPEFNDQRWGGIRIRPRGGADAGRISFGRIEILDARSTVDLPVSHLKSFKFSNDSSIFASKNRLPVFRASPGNTNDDLQLAVQTAQQLMKTYDLESAREVRKRIVHPALKIAAAQRLANLLPQVQDANLASSIFEELVSDYETERSEDLRIFYARSVFVGMNHGAPGFSWTRVMEAVRDDIGRAEYSKELSPLEESLLQTPEAFFQAAFAYVISLREKSGFAPGNVQYLDVPGANLLASRMAVSYFPELQEKGFPILINSLDSPSMMSEVQEMMVRVVHENSSQGVDLAKSLVKTAVTEINAGVRTVGGGSFELFDQHQQVTSADSLPVERRDYSWGFTENERDSVRRQKTEFSGSRLRALFAVLSRLAQIEPRSEKEDWRTRDFKDREFLKEVQMIALQALLDMVRVRGANNPRGDFGIMILAMEAIGNAGPFREDQEPEIFKLIYDEFKKIWDNDPNFGGLNCQFGDCDRWNREYEVVRNRAKVHGSKAVGRDFHSLFGGDGSSL